MSNAYFAVAIDSQFDPVFKARDKATVKIIDRSTFWTIALRWKYVFYFSTYITPPPPPFPPPTPPRKKSLILVH